MTDLEKLVEADRSIKRYNAEIARLHAIHIEPVEQARAAAGELANKLWVSVLMQYGSGEAQRMLRAAKGEE